MRNSESTIEPLLLLCCLVGAVSFFSLSMSVSKLIYEINRPNPKSEHANLDSLKKVLEFNKAQLDNLLKIKNDLTDKLKVPESDKGSSEEQIVQLEKRVSELKGELSTVQNKIIDLQKRLAGAGAEITPEQKSQMEQELKSLIQRREELRQAIQERGKKLAELRNSDKSAKEQTDQLQEQLQILADKVDSLRTAKNALSLKRLTSGTSDYQNPLYLDCKKDLVHVYPDNQTFVEEEFSSNANLVEKLSSGHDVIVLYVRPTGYNLFYKAYNCAINISLPVSYEPISNEQNLDFLRGK